jgi:hypothetical protein
MTSTTPQAARGKSIRIEYTGFRNAGDFREFDLAVHNPEGVVRFCFRIALSSFDGRAIRLQDGPDACYQVLLRMLAAGDVLTSQTITLGAHELTLYRDAHTPTPRAASVPRPQPPNPDGSTAAPPRRPAFTPAFRKTAAPPPPPAKLPYDMGQRVQHAVFGQGVTTSVLSDETVVWFDAHGQKTFRTAMLQLDILSPGGVWELGPRNKVRLRTPAN